MMTQVRVSHWPAADEHIPLRELLHTLAHRSEPATVSLTLVSQRRFHGGMLRIEAGIWLRVFDTHACASCFVLAVEASLVAGRGRCLFPVKDVQDHPQVVQSLQQRCTELAALLTALLSKDPAVQIRSGGAPLPLAWTWERPGDDLPFRFQAGHWTLVPEERTPGSPGSTG